MIVLIVLTKWIPLVIVDSLSLNKRESYRVGSVYSELLVNSSVELSTNKHLT